MESLVTGGCPKAPLNPVNVRWLIARYMRALDGYMSPATVKKFAFLTQSVSVLTWFKALGS